MTLGYMDDVPEPCPAKVAEVVSLAQQASDELFPELHMKTIRVGMIEAPGHHKYATTDRENTIWAVVRAGGLGEKCRADADSLALLCDAVAELHDAWRLPGLGCCIAHRYLAPAVVRHWQPPAGEQSHTSAA